MKALSRFAIRHRWWVIAGWITAIVLIQVLSSSAGGARYKDDFKLPGTDSQAAADLLAKAHLAQQNNPTGTLVLHARTGTLTSEPDGFVQRADKAVCGVADAHIATITTPWGHVACTPADGTSDATPRPDLISPDKRTAIVEVAYDEPKPADSTPKVVYDHLKTLRSPTLQVEFTGDTFDGVDAPTRLLTPQVLGFLAAFVILALVFRTFGATLLPMISAAAALGSGLGLIALLTHVMAVTDFTSALAELMVIGVGVDYALFIVTRHRRNLRRGLSVEESITAALSTAGRAVLFAGVTVCIAILGLCALGAGFLYGVAIGTAVAVSLTMLASLTLLPAMLSLLGRRALPRSQREELPSDKRVKLLLCVIPPLCVLFWVLYLLQGALRPITARLTARRAASTRPPLWTRWATLVQRRSVIAGVAAAVLLTVMALPFLSMRIGHPDQSNTPASSTSRKGYELIQQAYGQGYNSNLQLVVAGPGAADEPYMNKVTDTLAAVPNVNRSSITALPIGKDIALVAFKSISSPQDAKTVDLVDHLRDTALAPLHPDGDTQIYVYGETAMFVDFSASLADKMIYFILAVVGLSFLLLMVAFRSVLVALTAAAMNLLAAGASFGAIVAVFQWGWLSEPLGLGGGGPIEAFLPVLFFAILFGLSMDYQVFLVSRIHEEWLLSRDSHRAVTVGLSDTGAVITAAGLIMILVFGGFLLGNGLTIKLLGLGLALAVLLDAFIVRPMLVPAIMQWLGNANWWYPAWLDRITPHVTIEAHEEPAHPLPAPDLHAAPGKTGEA
ncbi:MMPL family transporter [Streptomyces tagetis]|uniref:MMPL family transporter n=1 Tax=Streptomyces tagetis TaxID=2820809 RepID=A0A941B0N1_9ACTN|nr:MMPL family transporter [Streptomyces sp. RG38]MBQ0825102.1 MMPL family transporter [Streptomyces sp. RG38]